MSKLQAVTQVQSLWRGYSVRQNQNQNQKQPPTSSQLARLGLARCLSRVAAVLEEGGSVELLSSQVFGNDMVQASIFSQNVSSAATILDLYLGNSPTPAALGWCGWWFGFALDRCVYLAVPRTKGGEDSPHSYRAAAAAGPVRSALIDQYGRRAGMVFPTALVSILQLYYVKNPTKTRYAVFETVAYSVTTFFTAFQASLEDMFDPSSEEYITASQRLEQAATLAHVCTLFALRQLDWLRSPAVAMTGAATMNLLSAAVASTAAETLDDSRRSAVKWKALVAGPFNAMRYFFRSPQIGSFHIQRTLFLSVMIGAMSVNGLYRRQVHGWTSKDFATQGLLAQLAALAAPFGALPMMRYFGLYGTVKWGERLHALQLLISIIAPSNFLWLTVVVSAFRYDMTASIREIGHWRSVAGVSFTESNVAVGSLISFVSVVMPQIFSRMYARTKPPVVFVLAIVMSLLHSEGVLPWLWPSRSESKSEQME